MTDESIFTAALDFLSPEERANYLNSACDTPEQRARLDTLLAAHDRAGSFLGRPAVALAAGDDATHTTAPDGPVTRTLDPLSGDPADETDATAFLAPPGRPDSLGRIGHYEVLEVLGRGGFGIVFRAFDEVLQRVVAVKVLAPHMAATSPARKRFLREARSAAVVQHEHVVRIHETGEAPLPYLVMEFVPGETLQQRMDRTGPLDVAEAVKFARQIAAGLSAAHEKGLIHRDIKPSNVLIDSGSHQAKITDFGLARAADDASLTRSGVVAGTPMYMAPEQARGEALDQRADLFSLGSVLYAMLTGHPPFRAANTPAVLKRVAEDAPRPIREVIPEVPEWACRIVGKLHAKDPADRFQTAQEVADLLADCEKQLTERKELTDFARIPGGKPVVRKPRRWRWAALSAGVALLLVLAVWFTPSARRYVTNRGVIEYVPADGLVSVTIYRSDGTVWGEIDASREQQIELPAGDYKLVAQVAPSRVFNQWQVSPFGFPEPRSSGQVGTPIFLANMERGDWFRLRATTRGAPTGPPPSATEFTPLFNGQDLTGWTTSPDSPGNWTVENGAIVGRGPHVSYLYSTAPAHADVHVRVEAKINRTGDSGLFVRVPELRLHRVLTGYEAQILLDGGDTTGTIRNVRTTTDELVKPDTWFTLEVIAVGNRLITKVNGRTTADTTDPAGRYPVGGIALQSGSPDNEVWFRKIEIQEPPAVAPFDDKQAKAHQEAWAKHLGVKVTEDGPLGMKLMLVPPGEFRMGSDAKEVESLVADIKRATADPLWSEQVKAESPPAVMPVTHPYQMSAHEVTNAQFRKFVEADKYQTEAEKARGNGPEPDDADPNWFQDKKRSWRKPGPWQPKDDHPVLCVSFNDAVAFCKWLSKESGRTCRLPTEVEWEFACRAGSDQRYSFGADPDRQAEYAVFLQEQPTAVGSKTANAFGLYDLEGNAWEWCGSKYGDSPGPVPKASDKRPIRGGGWVSHGFASRCASRWGYWVNHRDPGLGFRVVFDLPSAPSPIPAPPPAVAPSDAKRAPEPPDGTKK